MARHPPLPDIFTAFEGAGPAYPAEPLDEYRDLAMLARTWERIGSGDLTVDDMAESLRAGTPGSADPED